MIHARMCKRCAYCTLWVKNGSLMPLFRTQFPLAVWIVWRRLSDRLDRVGKKVSPDTFVEVLSVASANCGFPRSYATVSPLFVLADIGIANEPTRVGIRGLLLVDVDDRAKSLQSQQLPASTIMIPAPSGIKDVGESKETLFGCGRIEPLPYLVLVSGATEHDHPIDPLMQSESRRSGRSVRSSRNDDSLPIDLRV